MKMLKPGQTTHTAKPKKSSGDWHVSHTSMGMGDNYGSGIKNPLGKMRDDSMGMTAVTPKKLKKPPRSLA
jgi:hypothetical protein